MAKMSDAIVKFMRDYALTKDEVWEVHGSTWVVKHKALERIAENNNVSLAGFRQMLEKDGVAFERFRDPSHLRAWTMQEWRDALKKAHLAIGHEEQIYKKMEFKSWASRHDATMQALLRSMLAEVTPAVKAALEPQGADAELTFRLCEGLFIAKRT